MTTHLSYTRDVVACVVTDGESVCLVRRSEWVAYDQGRWHCVTGYIEPGETPAQSARVELLEELGLNDNAIDELTCGPVLSYHESMTLWRVHTFLVHTKRAPFQLNWENDDYRWASPNHSMEGCVPWLADVYRGLLCSLTPPPREEKPGFSLLAWKPRFEE